MNSLLSESSQGRIGAAYRASKANAKTPTALGAAAEVPPWVLVQELLPLSVVTLRDKFNSKSHMDEDRTHYMLATARTVCYNHVC